LLAAAGTPCVVVDCESGPVRLGLARRLAHQLNADHHPLTEVASAPLARLAANQSEADPGRKRLLEPSHPSRIHESNRSVA
ncbi:hypothetical protein JNW88_24960, partial [Micromonospora sp. ATA32]|nr:hypothetical protein [Micromonospora sp. ATA32]